MRKKTTALLFTYILLYLTATTIHAQEVGVGEKFKVGSLYYKIISVLQSEVAVSRQNNQLPSWDEAEKPTGDLIIPSSVSYQGTTYKVVEIDSYAFDRCKGITSVQIPDPIRVIGFNAFLYCSKLESVTIPRSMKSIGMQAFYDCTKLNEIKCDILNPKKSYVEASSFKNVPVNSCKVIVPPGTKLHYQNHSPWQMFENIEEYEIFVSANGINIQITSMILPISAKVTDNKSYTGEMLTIPAQVLYEAIEYPVHGIANEAFMGCSFHTATIPYGIRSIGERAFANANGMTKLIVNIESPIIDRMGADVFEGVNKSTCTLVVPQGCKKGYEVSVQWREFENIVEGNVGATFQVGQISYQVRNLESVRVIKQSNHYSLSGVKESPSGAITIPSTVSYNGRSYDVSEIGGNAFANNVDISSVSLPNSLKEISLSAFYGCTGLSAIEIPSSVRIIGTFAFSYCTNLKTVTIPNSIQKFTIGTFRNCVSLESVVIPNTVTSIADQTFDNCTGLKSLTIGESVNDIGKNAFRNCVSLQKINSKIVNPQFISTQDAFEGIDKATCKLIVPAGSKVSYEYSVYWKDFGQIQEESAAWIAQTEVDNSLKFYPNPATTFIHIEVPSSILYNQVMIFDLAGKTVYTGGFSKKQTTVDIGRLAKGVYLLQVGDIVRKLIVR